MLNLKKNLVFVLISIIPLISGIGGCASNPTILGFYEREAEILNPPQRRLLVETLRVIVLLEKYCNALEDKEIHTVTELYSSNYSHYEEGIEWEEQKIRERYIDFFAELSLSFRDISIEFVEKETGYWMRQEDFDWLRTIDEKISSLHPYLISFESSSGDLKMTLGEISGSSLSPRQGDDSFPERDEESGLEMEEGIREVKVKSSVDHGVDRPLGEVSLQMLHRGKLDGCRGTEVFTSSLEEKIILLLEKEDGEWKIISRW
ncbi:MAG: hypothetical protein U9N73_03655 [Candidatus Auribacterota bacterium]|nr:hypothetical protein [Candidatus Auribacterota bacterium]